MSAAAAQQVHTAPVTTRTRRRTRLSPELASVIQEIAESERALDGVLARSERLHRSGIDHSPMSCLVCFTDR